MRSWFRGHSYPRQWVLIVSGVPAGSGRAGIPSCWWVQQGASGPQQDMQPGKQAPQVLCSLIFTVGLRPLMLGLSLERAQDDLASLLQTSCLGSPSGHCPSAPCPATPLPPEWRHASIAIFPALSAPPTEQTSLLSPIGTHGSLTPMPYLGRFLPKCACKDPFSVAYCSKIT